MLVTWRVLCWRWVCEAVVLTAVLLTGASGMLGRYVLDSLHEEKIRAICLSRSPPKNLPINSIWHSFDLMEHYGLDDLERLAEDALEIWHVGALLPGKGVTDRMIFDANIKSVQVLSEFALQRGMTFRFISGATVYAQPHAKGIREDSALSATGYGGFYGSSKFFAEKILEYYSEHGLRVTILRPLFNLWIGFIVLLWWHVI